MYLFFPQWQGSGDQRMVESALALQLLLPHFDWYAVPVTLDDTPTENGIHQRAALVHQQELVRGILANAQPDTILTLGGDCNTALVPLQMLNRHYQGDLLVLWFDQHADLNTPESSPSGNFHGMPLRHALGEGDAAFCAPSAHALQHRQVVYIGAVQFDNAELEYIAAKDMTVLSVAMLHDTPYLLIQMLKNSPYSHVYIHMDTDCIDHRDFDGTGYPNDHGFPLDDLIRMLNEIGEHKQIVGATLTHYRTTDPDQLQTLARVFHALDIAMKQERREKQVQ